MKRTKVKIFGFELWIEHDSDEKRLEDAVEKINKLIEEKKKARPDLSFIKIAMLVCLELAYSLERMEERAEELLKGMDERLEDII